MMGASRELAELASSYNSGGLSNMRNRIINGAMVIDQRNAGASVAVTGGSLFYTLDRWLVYEDTDGACSVQRDTVAPTGFINSFKFTTTTADSSLSATQRAVVQQRIEGLNVFDLAWGTASAATVTLSFWVRSSLTGTFSGAFTNSDGNRSYPFTYTISSANTWEQKTVTVPGDTSGTWFTTNGVGILLSFGLGVGTTYSGTAGAWASSDLNSATGATSVIGTLNATWQITGVQLEKGSTATSFDYRPYGTELALCQRYLPAFNGNGTNAAYIGSGFAYATNSVSLLLPFLVQARVTPTGITATSGTIAVYQTIGTTNSTALVFGVASTPLMGSISVFATATAGTAGAVYLNSASAQILFTGCEL